MVFYTTVCFFARDIYWTGDQTAFDDKLVAAGIADREEREPSDAKLNEVRRQRRERAGVKDDDRDGGRMFRITARTVLELGAELVG